MQILKYYKLRRILTLSILLISVCQYSYAKTNSFRFTMLDGRETYILFDSAKSMNIANGVLTIGQTSYNLSDIKKYAPADSNSGVMDITGDFRDVVIDSKGIVTFPSAQLAASTKVTDIKGVSIPIKKIDNAIYFTDAVAGIYIVTCNNGNFKMVKK